MHKWITCFSLILLILVTAIYALEKKQFRASTPQPPSSTRVDLLALKPKETACMHNAVIEAKSQIAQIRVATYRRAGSLLLIRTVIKNRISTVTVPGLYKDNETINIPLSPPKKQRIIVFCVQNAGTQVIALYKSVIQQYPSPVTTFVNGKKQTGNFSLKFVEKSSVRRAERLGDITDRIQSLRPAILSNFIVIFLLFSSFVFAPFLAIWFTYRSIKVDNAKPNQAKLPAMEVPFLPQDAAPILGPSMIGNDYQRFLRLTWTMAITQFKLRFYGSALGYLWQLMRPLALFGVLYVVFTQFVKVGDRVPFYEVSLLLGIVLFVFFSEATTGSVRSLVDREALIRKVDFPRLAVPCSVVLTATINLMINLIVVAIFAAFSGVSLHASLLEIFPVIGMFIVFVSGLSAGLSALYIRYRDVNPIWEVIQQMVLYGTPIFYTIETVRSTNSEAAKWLMLNPFATVIQQLRHACIDPGAASAATAAGGWNGLFAACAITVIVFVVGFWLFYRESPRIAEEL